MNCKLFILLTGFTFFFNILYFCTGDTHKSNLHDPILSGKRTFFKGPSLGKALGKRSVDQGEDIDESYDYYFHEPEELQCSEDHFWHVRGLRCVPFECPGGNQFRDKHTGECILKSYGISNGGTKERPGRLFSSRMKSPTKFRLPFGLTLKG